VRDKVWEGRRTGEVANGDGDGGDGGEAHVVERGEVADHLGEGRVPIHHRVLRLRRRGDVRVHRVEQGGVDPSGDASGGGGDGRFGREEELDGSVVAYGRDRCPPRLSAHWKKLWA
jgi:hypothetical protein